MNSAAPREPSYWWVNQRMTYRKERNAGVLWTGKIGLAGQRVPHWDTMLDVRPGDIVLHYAEGIRALSIVATAALDSHRPYDQLSDRSVQEGHLIRTNYCEAAQPIALAEVPLSLRCDEPTEGPFNENGGVNRGYLYPLTDRFGQNFDSTFGYLFPARQPATALYVPAEAMVSATDLLRGLIGQPLTTVTGRVNTILGVQPPNVRVATGRSPNGQLVPIAWVDEALHRLRTNGAVTIHPSDSSHRSAFIGAVLQSLPGARVAGSPPVISFDPVDAAASPADESVYVGNLNRPYEGAQRGEQRQLRLRLLGTARAAECAVCGEVYPVEFLRVAHIKRRSVCTDDERRDLAYVAMLACIFGCDALFEAGYISADENGYVLISDDQSPHAALSRRLAALQGRPVTAYTEANAKYFEYHRMNVFRGVHRQPVES